MLTARTPQQTKEQINRDSIYGNVFIDPKGRGAIVGILNMYFGGDENRRTALAWLFDDIAPLSTKTLSDGQWYALHSWIGSHKDDSTGKWVVGDCFPTEAALVLQESLLWYANSKKGDLSNFDNPNKVLISGASMPGALLSNVSSPLGTGRSPVWLADPEKVEIPKEVISETKKGEEEIKESQPKETPPDAGHYPAWSKPPTKKSALRPIKF